MPGSAWSEIYFISAMMLLILIFSGATVYFFFRQYRKEMQARKTSSRDIPEHDTSSKD
jgi:hypothetical protein